MTYQNGTTYPYTDRDLRRDNPGVSFPPLTDEIRAEYGMTPVTTPPRPEPIPGKTHVLSSQPVNGALEWIEVGIPEQQLLDAAQAECKRRILEVVSTTMQINMAAASAAGLLTEAQSVAYTEGLLWIASMRATWRQIVDDGIDVYDDANWPECPTSAVEFANNF